MSDVSETTKTRPRSLVQRGRSWIRLFLGTLMIVSVAINFSNVIARYILQAPIFWAETIITYIMLWSAFIGAALITLDDKHLSIDLVASVFPRRSRSVVLACSAACLLAVALIVVPQSWQATEMLVRNDQRTAVEGLPLAIPNAALLVGFGLMALAGVYQLVAKVRQALSPQDDATASMPPASSSESEAKKEAGY
ncbi:MAG: hypothetical protein CML02_02190 [Pseudooceanicola sp.]|nr:hypothetical protein [Pseudooceanicola sp.]